MNQTAFKSKMANKHRKKCLTAIAITEMQVKAIARFHLSSQNGYH
jgi:hypothetical protein